MTDCDRCRDGHLRYRRQGGLYARETPVAERKTPHLLLEDPELLDHLAANSLIFTPHPDIVLKDER
ncbi:MAG: hypothetical protein R2758_13040 [Bacteroidales bacterium]